MKQELKNSGSKSRGRLVRSMMALLLCVAMFAGSTWAWFTDTANNTGNTIKAGNLDIDLLMDKKANGTYTSIAGSTGDIFTTAAVAQNGSATLWEPGKTQIVYLAVENKGNLDAAVNVIFDISDSTETADVKNNFSYILFDDVKKGDIDFTQMTWGDLAESYTVHNITLNNVSFYEKELVQKDTTKYFALALRLNSDAPNSIQGKEITFSINVTGLQAASEDDGFGNHSYDVNSSTN